MLKNIISKEFIWYLEYSMKLGEQGGASVELGQDRENEYKKGSEHKGTERSSDWHFGHL